MAWLTKMLSIHERSFYGLKCFSEGICFSHDLFSELKFSVQFEIHSLFLSLSMDLGPEPSQGVCEHLAAFLVQTMGFVLATGCCGGSGGAVG